MCSLNSSLVYNSRSTTINFNKLQFCSRYLVNDIALFLVFTTGKKNIMLSQLQVLNSTLHPSYYETEHHLAVSYSLPTGSYTWIYTMLQLYHTFHFVILHAYWITCTVLYDYEKQHQSRVAHPLFWRFLIYHHYTEPKSKLFT